MGWASELLVLLAAEAGMWDTLGSRLWPQLEHLGVQSLQSRREDL